MRSKHGAIVAILIGTIALSMSNAEGKGFFKKLFSGGGRSGSTQTFPDGTSPADVETLCDGNVCRLVVKGQIQGQSFPDYKAGAIDQFASVANSLEGQVKQIKQPATPPAIPPNAVEAAIHDLQYKKEALKEAQRLALDAAVVLTEALKAKGLEEDKRIIELQAEIDSMYLDQENAIRAKLEALDRLKPKPKDGGDPDG